MNTFIMIVNTDCYPKIVGLSHFIYTIKIYYSKIYTKHFTWRLKCVQYVWHVAWYLCGSNYLISKKSFKCVFKTRISNEREWEWSCLLYIHIHASFTAYGCDSGTVLIKAFFLCISASSKDSCLERYEYISCLKSPSGWTWNRIEWNISNTCLFHTV